MLEENVEMMRRGITRPTEIEIELKKRLEQLTDRLIQKQLQVCTNTHTHTNLQFINILLLFWNVVLKENICEAMNSQITPTCLLFEICSKLTKEINPCTHFVNNKISLWHSCLAVLILVLVILLSATISTLSSFYWEHFVYLAMIYDLYSILKWYSHFVLIIFPNLLYHWKA